MISIQFNELLILDTTILFKLSLISKFVQQYIEVIWTHNQTNQKKTLTNDVDPWLQNEHVLFLPLRIWLAQSEQ